MVYIELVLFNNFFLDAMLAIATLTARRRRIKVWRILLSSTVGSVAATLYAIAPEWTQIFIRILLAPLLCVIFTPPQGKNAANKLGDYIGTTVIFILFTFLTGGVIFGVSYALNVDVKSYAVLGLIAIGVTALLLSARLIARKRSAQGAATTQITVSAAGQDVKVNALCDSGNLLIDDVSGLPVVILSSEAEARFGELDCKGFIQVGTVGGEDSLTLVDIDEVKVMGRSFKAMGALARRSFDGFEVILQNSMF